MFISEYPSSVCLVLDYGEWKLLISKVNRLLISVDFKYANYFAIDFVDLIFRLIYISLCSFGANEKFYGLNANF